MWRALLQLALLLFAEATNIDRDYPPQTLTNEYEFDSGCDWQNKTLELIDLALQWRSRGVQRCYMDIATQNEGRSTALGVSPAGSGKLYPPWQKLPMGVQEAFGEINLYRTTGPTYDCLQAAELRWFLLSRGLRDIADRIPDGHWFRHRGWCRNLCGQYSSGAVSERPPVWAAMNQALRVMFASFDAMENICNDHSCAKLYRHEDIGDGAFGPHFAEALTLCADDFSLDVCGPKLMRIGQNLTLVTQITASSDPGVLTCWHPLQADIVYTIVPKPPGTRVVRALPGTIVGPFWCQDPCNPWKPTVTGPGFYEVFMFAGERFVVRNATWIKGGYSGQLLDVVLEQQPQPAPPEQFQIPPPRSTRRDRCTTSPEQMHLAMQWKTKGVQMCYDEASVSNSLFQQLAEQGTTPGTVARSFGKWSELHPVLRESIGEAALFWSMYPRCVLAAQLAGSLGERHTSAVRAAELGNCSRLCGPPAHPDRVPLSVSAAAAWALMQRANADLLPCDERCSRPVYYTLQMAPEFELLFLQAVDNCASVLGLFGCNLTLSVDLLASMHRPAQSAKAAAFLLSIMPSPILGHLEAARSLLEPGSLLLRVRSRYIVQEVKLQPSGELCLELQQLPTTLRANSSRPNKPKPPLTAEDLPMPPLWSVFLVQLASVVGDAFGQRASRVEFKKSSRHMLLGLSAMSAAVVFVGLGATELLLSADVTGAQYEGAEQVPCYLEIDYFGNEVSYCDQAINPSRACTQAPCPAQGPFSAIHSLAQHPLLMLNGVLALVYHIAEVLLIQHPLGVVLKPIAAVASSVCIGPLQDELGFGEKQSPLVVTVIGLLGATLCVFDVEVLIKKTQAWYLAYQRGGDRSSEGESAQLEMEEHNTLLAEQPKRPHPSSNSPSSPSKLQHSPLASLGTFFGIGTAFFGLAFTNAIWMVIQKFVNDRYRLNVFGYTALDQVVSPFYMALWLWVTDKIVFARPVLLSSHDQGESFGRSMISTWNEAADNGCKGMWWLFIYRFLSAARVMVYFYMSINYNLNILYFELTLVRVGLSWMWTALVAACIPGFIGVSAEERANVFAPRRLAVKAAGTVLILIALILMLRDS